MPWQIDTATVSWARSRRIHAGTVGSVRHRLIVVSQLEAPIGRAERRCDIVTDPAIAFQSRGRGGQAAVDIAAQILKIKFHVSSPRQGAYAAQSFPSTSFAISSA